MTNFEKHKERIKEIVSEGYDFGKWNGELGICRIDIRDCDGCEFDKKGEGCSLTTLKWLLADDGTPSAERLTGQKESWELARKIAAFESYGGLSIEELDEIFGCNCLAGDIMAENTYAEAAEKVKAWEDGKKFKVGDVLERAGLCGVILEFIKGERCLVITQDGHRFPWNISDCTKTGRTLPVKDWLRQIGGGE